jgi:hypothetical protein
MRFPYLLSSLCIITLSACSQTASKMEPADAKEIAADLIYVKDPRTKQCFAAVASRHVAQVSQNGFTITWVPCTPEVDSIVQK